MDDAPALPGFGTPPEARTLYYGDCLDWMQSWDSRSVDLIYLDPPFNSDATYNILYRHRKAGKAQYRAFDDTWYWNEKAAARLAVYEGAAGRPAAKAVVGLYRILGESGMLAYLTYMAERLEQMKRLLKPSGTIYLHCNQVAAHYLKVLMDTVFGSRNFINEIIWNYGTPSGGRAGGMKPVKTHDTLLSYAGEYGKHCYNRQHTPYRKKYIREWFRHEDRAGRRYRTRSRGGEIVRQYLDQSPGVPLSTVWSDIMQLSSRRGWFPKSKAAQEETGYPTQKPRVLLERIIKASSNEGDLVLDPFCGCGTAVDAANRLRREWAGIDISSFAIDLIRLRRMSDLDIAVKGAPFDFKSAEKLARDKPFEFESWAIMRLPGFVPNTVRVGDGGIDGRATLLSQPTDHKSRLALAQVKGGSFSASQLRDFLHVINREKAALGVYITLTPVQSATARAAAMGAGEVTVGANKYPRCQLWSIADHFDRRRPNLPTMTDPYTGQPLLQEEISWDSQG